MLDKPVWTVLESNYTSRLVIGKRHHFDIKCYSSREENTDSPRHSRGYFPKNFREWQNRERRDLDSMRIGELRF